MIKPLKTCPKCKKSKDLLLFSKNRRTKDGLSSWCKSCMAPLTSKWQKDHKAANREKLLKSRYGITSTQYKYMFEKQEGKCAICRKHQSEFKRSLSVDHDHSTQIVRELLCDLCNRALGYLKDSPILLKMAAAYLEKHSGTNQTAN